MRRLALRSDSSEAPSLMLPNSVVKEVLSATHVLAYALRITKLINSIRSHCERKLLFVIEEFSDSEIITL